LKINSKKLSDTTSGISEQTPGDSSGPARPAPQAPSVVEPDMWIRFVTVFACVVAVLGLGPSAAHAPLDLPPRIERTAARLDALSVAITGSVEELRASEVLNHHRVEGGVAACMAAAGRSYRQLPFASFYDGFTDADLGYGTGRATVLDSVTEGGRRIIRNTVSTGRLTRAGLVNQGPNGAPAGATAADVDALNRCTGPYGHRRYLDFDPPPGAHELSDFTELLEAAHRDPDVVAAWRRYDPCMRDRLGHDVPDRSDFLFRERISPRDAPGDGEAPKAAWTRGLAEIRAAFAVDVACRLPAYLAAMRVVAANLDAWELRHRTELDTIRAAWRQRVADAARLPR
jgi:hypothetical protein